MAFRIFMVPLSDPDAAEEELNAFLRGHRILGVEKCLLDRGSESCWTFCVDFLESGGTRGGDRRGRAGNRVDYRERLSTVQFARYVSLKEWRKQTAQEEAVPISSPHRRDRIRI